VEETPEKLDDLPEHSKKAKKARKNKSPLVSQILILNFFHADFVIFIM